ncbi:MAG: hypothetical protein SOU27_09660 [Sodaliphilus sp.]|jgi:hypothetical protein|nr:hypothetical protein [Sodaliphilus sp.]
MSTRVKSILIYVGGIFTGIIIMCVLSLCVAKHNADGGLVIFEQPGQKIELTELKIIQVLNNESALATGNDLSNYGTVFLLLPKDGVSYYDDQKITVPSGKFARQIGTYRYISKNDVEKTVPVIDFYDK